MGDSYSNVDSHNHAVIWKNGATIDIGQTNVSSYALGVSGDGSTVVAYESTSQTNAIRWDYDGNVTATRVALSGDVGNVGDDSKANAISRDGTTIVGYSDYPTLGTDYASPLKWSNGSTTPDDLGVPTGFTSGQAQAVSADGSIISGSLFIIPPLQLSAFFAGHRPPVRRI